MDESAITGESTPVIREAGGDHSGVTGGTLVLSDRIVVEITAEHWRLFLGPDDRACRRRPPAAHAERDRPGADLVGIHPDLLDRHGRPVADGPVHRRVHDDYVGRGTGEEPGHGCADACSPARLPHSHDHWALLAAIGIAGMDRALRANIIAKSGKAVEVAGDIDTLLLDKTGTITVGNRRATQFVPLGGYTVAQVGQLAALASVADHTPEGKSIVALFQAQGIPQTQKMPLSRLRALTLWPSPPRRA